MSGGTATLLAGIIVALISTFGAYASNRAAGRAATTNTQTTSRVDMEKDAYERARKFDTDTITRQDGEIAELRTEILEHIANEKELKREIDTLKANEETLNATIRTQGRQIETLEARVRTLEGGPANG